MREPRELFHLMRASLRYRLHHDRRYRPVREDITHHAAQGGAQQEHDRYPYRCPLLCARFVHEPCSAKLISTLSFVAGGAFTGSPVRSVAVGFVGKFGRCRNHVLASTNASAVIHVSRNANFGITVHASNDCLNSASRAAIAAITRGANHGSVARGCRG